MSPPDEHVDDGQATTASPIDAELLRRLAAVEKQYEGLREDVQRYTEHCIRLMKASTQLAILMQEYGIDTRSAAKLLDPKSAH